MGMRELEINRIWKLLPKYEFNESLKYALARNPRLKLNKLSESDPAIAEMLDISFRLSGLIRHLNVHAAAIVIAPKDVREFMPVAGNRDTVMSMSQISYRYVERLGLIRFDHLGLKNLTLNDSAAKMIRSGKNPEFDLQRIQLDDKATFELISSGDTDSVFQFESSGMKELLMKLKPSCFEDVVAACALYRPVPLQIGMVDDLIERKHGRQPITYILPELEPILANTYGVLVYQEQVMLMAHAVAGYSLGQADLLRRTIGKQLLEDIMKEKELLFTLSVRRGVALVKSEEVFDFLLNYCSYSFNKAHAVAYALIAYHSAWLKAHYPDQFALAVELVPPVI
jgi:DNA polymerase-3 subunit alpha